MVSVDIARVCMMGRPLALREENILLKRERANLDMSGPNMGM